MHSYIISLIILLTSLNAYGKLVGKKARLNHKPTLVVIKANTVATIYVDGILSGETGQPLNIKPRHNILTLKAPGFKAKRLKIKPRKGVTSTYQIKLQRLPRAKSRLAGKVQKRKKSKRRIKSPHSPPKNSPNRADPLFPEEQMSYTSDRQAEAPSRDLVAEFNNDGKPKLRRRKIRSQRHRRLSAKNKPHSSRYAKQQAPKRRPTTSRKVEKEPELFPEEGPVTYHIDEPKSSPQQYRSRPPQRDLVTEFESDSHQHRPTPKFRPPTTQRRYQNPHVYYPHSHQRYAHFYRDKDNQRDYYHSEEGSIGVATPPPPSNGYR